MTLLELKTSIINHKISDKLLVLVCSENNFLANQYINAISTARNLPINKINTLAETVNSALSLVIDFNNSLNVLRIDTFAEAADNYDNFLNTIIICDKIDLKIKAALEPYTVLIPKLVDWQVKAYIQTICPGLSNSNADYLYGNTEEDIFRIETELDKIKNFPIELQQDIFKEIILAKDTDIFTYNIFDLQRALLTQNKGFVNSFMQHIKQLNVDPIGLNSLLLAQAKKILYLNFGSGVTKEQLGVSSGVAYYLRNDYSCISKNKIHCIVKFLSGIDLKLKSNLLDMPKDQILDYIICGMMAIK